MTVVLMSRAELSRIDTLARVDRGELPAAEAASLLGLSERQVFRLLSRLRSEGATGLASRRRGRPSELVQIDSYEHAWFEDRDPPCTLLAFVYDATGRLMHLRFVPAESAFAYMA